MFAMGEIVHYQERLLFFIFVMYVVVFFIFVMCYTILLSSIFVYLLYVTLT